LRRRTGWRWRLFLKSWLFPATNHSPSMSVWLRGECRWADCLEVN